MNPAPSAALDIDWDKLRDIVSDVVSTIGTATSEIAAGMNNHTTQLGGDIRWTKNTIDSLAGFAVAVRPQIAALADAGTAGMTTVELAAISTLREPLADLPTSDGAAARAALLTLLPRVTTACGQLAANLGVIGWVAPAASVTAAQTAARRLPDALLDRVAPHLPLEQLEAFVSQIGELTAATATQETIDPGRRKVLFQILGLARLLERSAAWLAATLPMSVGAAAGIEFELVAFGPMTVGMIAELAGLCGDWIDAYFQAYG